MILLQAIDILGKNSLPLWQLRLLHVQAKCPENLENFFKDALKGQPDISNYFKPVYVEYLVLTKGNN